MTSRARFVPLRYPTRSIEERREAIRSLRATLSTRRTVRDFSPDPVPLDLIEEAVAVANSAPSGANMQPWHFVIVGDQEMKKRIRVAAEKEERDNYERRMTEEWKEALAPLGTDWEKAFLEIAPWLVVVFRVDWSFTPSGGRKKHYYVSESVGIAVGFLLAALHHAGLAALTHTPSPMGFLAEILSRPQNEKPFLLIPVGYPALDCLVPDITKIPPSGVTTVFPAPNSPSLR